MGMMIIALGAGLFVGLVLGAIIGWYSAETAYGIDRLDRERARHRRQLERSWTDRRDYRP